MISVLIAIGFFVIGALNALFFVIGFACKRTYEKIGKIKPMTAEKLKEESKLEVIRPTKERYERIKANERGETPAPRPGGR